MNRKLLFGIGAVIVLAAAGFWLYDWVLGEPLAASAPIEAAPIVIQEPTATPDPEPTEAVVTVEEEEQIDPTPTQEVVQEDEESASNVPEGYVVLSIVPEESEARFNIYELLNGQDKDVIGTTNQVAGQVAVNPDDISQVQFGPIQVNARTFATDESRRNNAIRNRILNTDQYEFITFTPTSIEGLSGAGAVGESYTFQLTGDLTIKDVTNPVTFEVSLQAESGSRLSGSASTTIKRSDFNLNVPSVPFVANVADEFDLELDFVMDKVE